jgi:hypothetical protein
MEGNNKHRQEIDRKRQVCDRFEGGNPVNSRHLSGNFTT